MTIKIKPVENRKDLKKFIQFPGKIHRNHDKWVPPIYRKEWKYFDPNKNRAFSYSSTLLALAYEENEVVGRIMGIINHRYNRCRNEKNARFGYLECPNDQNIIHALLTYIEQWAKREGMDKIVGPMGFSDQDPEGFLLEGFNYEPTLATYYNFEYIIPLIEAENYIKEVDYVVYKVDIPNENPEFYNKIVDRIHRKKIYTLLEFKKRKELKKFIKPILALMNDCFKEIYGYLPLEEEEMIELAKQYLVILNPRFIKVIKKNGSLAAFIIAVPNMSPGIRKAGGRLFPFGIFKILAAVRKTHQLDILIGGIKKEDRGKGLDVLLGDAVFKEARRAKLEFLDSHHQLELNTKVRAEMERLGGRVIKRFRIYQKQL